MCTSVGSRTDICGQYFCAMKNESSDFARYLAFPLRCKTWECPTCRRIKADEYRDRAMKLQMLPQLYMLTLTYFRGMSLEDAWRTYNDSWNRLRTALVKRYGHFNFIRVLEHHKNKPYPHLHIIVDVYFEPHWFGPEVVRAGFGYQMDMHPITGDGAIGYVLKYLSKGFTSDQAIALRRAYRCRIISFSRGLLSPAKRSDGWNLLVLGSGFDVCLDHIKTDYTWRTGRQYEVSYENVGDSSAEITVFWTDRPIEELNSTTDTWEPDDWVVR